MTDKIAEAARRTLEYWFVDGLIVRRRYLRQNPVPQEETK